MKRCMALGWLWLVVCLIPLTLRAADVQAVLDRTQVALGETVTLNLSTTENSAGQIQLSQSDLSALQRDFAVLGTSNGNSFSFVNGQMSSQVTLGIVLRPLHTGTLRIPSLSFAGETTTPLTLEVVTPNVMAAAQNGKDVFLEASIEPQSGYIGQQLVYTMRLYYAVNLPSGTFGEPSLSGVDVRRMGGDVSYSTERGGRNYIVDERKYALLPQIGGHLVIPPVAFHGTALDMSNPNAIFNNLSDVSVVTPEIPIEIRPIPAAAAHTLWLPARQVTLTLKPDTNQVMHVGDPFHLVMTVQAIGLPYETLPALSLPTLDGATTYPDKSTGSTAIADQWLVGQRQQGFTIVPNRPGTLTIPETTLTWWNVLADRLEVARIPALSFTVLPAAGAAGSAPAVLASATTTAMPPSVSTAIHPSLPNRLPAVPWRWIALGSLGLWLAAMIGGLWWWRRRRVRSSAAGYSAGKNNATETKQVPANGQVPVNGRIAFLEAAQHDNDKAMANALLAWARTERPSLPLQNLGELSAALVAPPQCAAIAALQHRHYAEAQGAPLGEQLAAAFRAGFAWRQENDTAHHSPLPPLYPFDLHD